MNTKIATSIEQSKKLIELGLNPNTADMYWDTNDTGGRSFTLNIGKHVVIRDSLFSFRNGLVFPAWSLAALYNILPNNEKESTTLSRGGWKIAPPEYIDNWWCEYEDERHTEDFTVSADNPVDACVNMIIKLYELNLL